MAPYILLLAMLTGLLMYLLASNSKAQDIGRMLLIASFIGLMVALAPFTVAKFFH
jgi:hypothetical protein